MKTGLVFEEIREKIPRIVDALFTHIPSGVGSEGAIPKLTKDAEKRLLRDGANWAVANGYGRAEDLDHTEESGCLESADAELISDRALERGLGDGQGAAEHHHYDPEPDVREHPPTELDKLAPPVTPP